MWPYTWQVAVYAIPCFILLGWSISPYCIILPLTACLFLLTFHKVVKDELKIGILIVAAVLVEIIIFYNCIPLLWRKPQFLLFLLVAHFFVGNSVLYGILGAGVAMPQREILEVMSLAAYPAACAFILAWLMTASQNAALFPYAFIAINFVFLQYALWPRVSCYRHFQKYPAPSSSNVVNSTLPDERRRGLFDDKEPDLIVEPIIIGLASLWHTLSPSIIFLLFTIGKTFGSLILPHLVESGFIFSLSLFTATLLPVNIFVKAYNLPSKCLTVLRLASGGLSISLLSSVLFNHDIHSELLLGIKIRLLLFIILTVAPYKGFLKLGHGINTAGICFLHGWQLIEFPWDFSYMPGDSAFIPKVYLSIFVCVLIALCILWNLKSRLHKLIRFLVPCLILVFHWCEWQLHSAHLVPSFVLWLSAIPTIYSLLLLQRNLWMGSVNFCFCMSMTLSKCLLLFYNHVEAAGARLHFGWFTYKCVFSPIFWSIFFPMHVPRSRFTTKGVIVTTIAVMDMIISSAALSFIFVEAHLIRFDIFLSLEHNWGFSMIFIGLCLCPLSIQTLMKPQNEISSKYIRYSSLCMAPMFLLIGIAELLLVFLVLENRLALIPIGLFLAACLLLLWGWQFVSQSPTSMMRFIVAASFVLSFILMTILHVLTDSSLEVVTSIGALFISSNTLVVIFVSTLLPFKRLRLWLPKLTLSLLVNDTIVSIVCGLVGSIAMGRAIAIMCTFSMISCALAIIFFSKRRQNDVNYVELDDRWNTEDLSNLCIGVAAAYSVVMCLIYQATTLILFVPVMLFLLRSSRFLKLRNRMDHFVLPRLMFILIVLILVWQHSYLLQSVWQQREILTANSHEEHPVSASFYDDEDKEDAELLFIPLHWHQWERGRSIWEMLVSLVATYSQLLHAWRRWNPYSSKEVYGFYEVMFSLLLVPIVLTLVLVGTSSYAVLFGIFSSVVTSIMLMERVD